MEHIYRKNPGVFVANGPIACISKSDLARIKEDACVGCTICKKACPVEAIEGELKEKHRVVEDKCIGCGACAPKCPKKAIELR